MEVQNGRIRQWYRRKSIGRSCLQVNPVVAQEMFPESILTGGECVAFPREILRERVISVARWLVPAYLQWLKLLLRYSATLQTIPSKSTAGKPNISVSPEKMPSVFKRSTSNYQRIPTGVPRNILRTFTLTHQNPLPILSHLEGFPPVKQNQTFC